MFGKRQTYVLNITMRDQPYWEVTLQSAIAISRADVSYSVIRRLRGELLIALSGPRLDVQKVDTVGQREGWW